MIPDMYAGVYLNSGWLSVLRFAIRREQIENSDCSLLCVGRGLCGRKMKKSFLSAHFILSSLSLKHSQLLSLILIADFENSDEVVLKSLILPLGVLNGAKTSSTEFSLRLGSD